jgi:hypothetical protein
MPVKFISDCSFSFLGEQIQVEQIVLEFTDVRAEPSRKRASSSRAHTKGDWERKKHPAGTGVPSDGLEIRFLGTERTTMSIRRARPDEVAEKVFTG